MLNIPELYQKHRPAGADEAMRRAMERAAENAARIADAYERSGFDRVCRRQIDAAGRFAEAISGRFGAL